jgi:hypothetical protein
MTLRLFDTWQGSSLGGIIAEYRELVEDAEFPAVKRGDGFWSFSGLLSIKDCSCGRVVVAENRRCGI